MSIFYALIFFYVKISFWGDLIPKTRAETMRIIKSKRIHKRIYSSAFASTGK